MADIALEHITKRFPDGTTAVDDAHFTIADGEFFILVGPSGCGKSTLLNIIVGLEPPTGGNVRIGGRVVNDVDPKDRNMAMVFQSYAIYPHMSVRENLAFPLKLAVYAKDEINRRVQDAAKMLELTELLDRLPASLSGGQRQRVAMGRAMVREPAAFLMDEPLSNLDAKLRHEMRIEIRDLQRRLGMTVVYVTHDQAEAMSLADKVILMRDGRIEQEGPPDELYERPANTFAANFIGTPPMNLIDLRRVAQGPARSNPAVAALLERYGDWALLGVRPENVHIGTQDGLPARLQISDYLGADTIVNAELAGQTVAIRVAGRMRAHEGENVQLSWSEDAAHLFDPATGQRVEREPTGAARSPCTAQA